jgi:hypothetical protein
MNQSPTKIYLKAGDTFVATAEITKPGSNGDGQG